MTKNMPLQLTKAETDEIAHEVDSVLEHAARHMGKAFKSRGEANVRREVALAAYRWFAREEDVAAINGDGERATITSNDPDRYKDVRCRGLWPGDDLHPKRCTLVAGHEGPCDTSGVVR